MKIRPKFLMLTVLFVNFSLAQNNKEIAFEKGKEAISQMDHGKIEESILLLQESQKLDPENFDYPYEIAYAHYLKKEYRKSIEILEKLETYHNINERLYTLWGNSYDMLGNSTQAIEIYNKGISKFPNKGLLYLEKGIVYEFEKKYDKAVQTYQQGISVEPIFSSNYYRLANLYLQSADKTPGLVYGEIFINLERTTNRTKEMSKNLFEVYGNSVVFDDKGWKELNLCREMKTSVSKNESLKFPFCMIFGTQFSFGLIKENPKEINLCTLSKIRFEFIKTFFNNKKISNVYPNILFSYHRKMIENNVFEAYNHYVFQMGAEQEFSEWKKTHEAEFNKFIEWYTNNENIIAPTKENYWNFVN